MTTRALNAPTLPTADIDIRVSDIRVSETSSPDMTQALLRDALARLQAAEQIIAAQEKTIRDLEDIASTDLLTGLMNRRGLENFFEQELSRMRRGTSEGAVLVMIDLDGFKAINDTYGHKAGDECLKEVATQLLNSIRISDGAARFGGDEFAILLTQTDPKKVLSRVQSIRSVLNSVAFKWEGQELACGGSVGTAPVNVSDKDFSVAYLAADTALYVDKTARKKPVPAR